MPASNFNLYNMKHARNNFDAMRPAPVYNEAYQSKGQKVHISTNCYHGFHQQKAFDKSQDINDWEMQETSVEETSQSQDLQSSHTTNMRKRSADDEGRPQPKRFREEVQRETNIEPETIENINLKEKEDLLEKLYWNTHGGNLFHLL